MEERLSKVEGISHELLHLNSSVPQIQQKLDENPSEASRQLREQGRQIEQKGDSDQFRVQEFVHQGHTKSQVFEIHETEKSGEVQFRGVEIVSEHCIEGNHENSFGFVEKVTGSVVNSYAHVQIRSLTRN
jgi:hypothetical protein